MKIIKIIILLISYARLNYMTFKKPSHRQCSLYTPFYFPPIILRVKLLSEKNIPDIENDI